MCSYVYVRVILCTRAYVCEFVHTRDILDRFNVVLQKALTHSDRYDDKVRAIIRIIRLPGRNYV